MCTASVMFSPPSSGSLALSLATTPRQERRHGAVTDRESQTSRAAFTQYQTPRRTPATSLILRSVTPGSLPRSLFLSTNKQRFVLSGSPRQEKQSSRFDLLVYLPLEVSIMILEYLHPKDLCQVCKVSSDWYRLSQHPPLLKQRKQYIKTLREEYQLSKENYPPPTLLENGTPQQQASFVPSRHMTVGQSPLNIIQPKSSHRNSNQRTNPPAPPTSGHTQSSLSPRGLGETPCPAYLLENVQKLSLDDGVAEVRRCLFPTAEISPTHIHRNLARPAWNQRNSYKCCTKGELMAGKKSNRCRLRRL